MWSVNEPSQAAWSSEAIVPQEVLYEFNGPLTFVASFGPFEALFHHLGQRPGSNFYAVVQASDETVSALKAGILSVRGALNVATIWIVDLDEQFRVRRYWACDSGDFPEKLLPRNNIALYPNLAIAPDSLAEANAYFSVAYRGDHLTRKSVPFSLLKSLVDDTYEAARRLLSPAFMTGAKSRTYDFPAQAMAGSFVLILDEPEIHEGHLKRRTADAPLSLDDAQASFAKQRDLFFQETAEIVDKADAGQLTDALAEERFGLLDNLQQIIPSDQNRIESVVFTAREGQSVVSIAINERVGKTIHRAFKRIEKQAVTDIGRVEIVNAPSRTFVYRSSRGKQVTCHIPSEAFQRLQESGRLQTNAVVRVKGFLSKRPNRDLMNSEFEPEVSLPVPSKANLP